jgi:hypothetical protein
LRDGPEFLLGGFGRDDDFPSIYRVMVKENKINKDFGDSKTGVSWNGQSDAVERFIRGYDGEVRRQIEGNSTDHLTQHSGEVKTFVASKINEILDKLGQKLPDGVSVDVPELKKIKLEWMKYKADLDYANLPLQEAIDFVSFLVNLQSGKSRFSRGVATVGGRTHISYITKEKGFTPVDEPVLRHRHTGFGDDL